MFQRFFAIAANTYLETLRQPIYSVILLATTLLLILNVSLAGFTLEDDDKLLLDLGLSTLLLSGLFLASFSASSAINREIENKTVLIVVSKPVNRPLFLLAKVAGLFMAVTLAFYISVLVFVLTQRHGVLQNSSDPWDGPVLAFGFGSLVLALFVGAFRNYFYGKEFATSTVSTLVILLTIAVLAVAKLDKTWNITPFAENFVGGQVLLAAFLVFLNILFITAVAVTASTRFGQLLTLVICSCVLALGIASDYTFGQHVARYSSAAVAYAVVPNMGPFWVIDGLHAGTEQTAVTWEYIAYTTAYAFLIISAVLGIGVAAFQKREVG